MEAFFQRLPNTSLLCVGDVMVDYFIYGTVDRISPEAPVPVFHKTHQTQALGGAGNVARNLSYLSARTIFLSVTGQDEEGEKIQQLLDALPSTQSFLIQDPDRTTTVKTRYISHNQQLLRADQETRHPLSAPLKKKLKEAFQEALPQVDGVIFSDYGKGIFDRELTLDLLHAAKQHHKPVFIDPKSQDYGIYEGATILTPNLNELRQVAKKALATEEEIVQGARFLMEKYQIGMMLVTRGEQGMTLVEPQQAYHIPTQALEVFDVSGAGDTVIALFSLGVSAGIEIVEAAKLANAAAGIVVGKVGTATTTLKEVQDRLMQFEFVKASSKVLTLPEALEKVISWKRQGLKIGFTNGCFDLLHPGHLSLLSQAKAQCHRLIVGINSDASVKRLKGVSRPIQNEHDRACILASLELVDGIVIFEEDTPLSLITKLRPEVLVKGADYTLEKVVGAQEVLSWGGQVILADLVPEKSTTRTIQRMT